MELMQGMEGRGMGGNSADARPLRGHIFPRIISLANLFIQSQSYHFEVFVLQWCLHRANMVFDMESWSL